MSGTAMKLTESIIEFKVNGKLVKFTVYHDLPDTFGLNIQAAVENWTHRTQEYTAESLVEYVLSKDTGHMMMTKEEFDEFIAVGAIKKLD